MWCKNHDCCKGCGTVDRKHMAKGMCNLCYLAQYRNTESNKEQISKTKADWHQKYRTRQLARSKARRERVHFDDKREQALQRDGHACVRCGGKNKLTVHHKDRHGRGTKKPNNRLSNLETVCRKCHINEHRPELLAARDKQYITPILNENGVWHDKYDSCVLCGSTTSPYCATGKCSKCYQRQQKIKHKMT